MNYDKIQLSTISRHRNNVETVKITDIQGNNLIFELHGRAENFPVSYPAEFKVGEYIDVIFFNNSGSRNSHGIKLVGHTPPEFCSDAKAVKNDV